MNKGSHGGIPAKAISKLMRSSYYKAKKEIKELYEKLGTEELSLEQIGDMIYEFRKNKDSKKSASDRSFDMYARWL